MLEIPTQLSIPHMSAPRQPGKSSIVFVGSEWFPQKPGGLSRYLYELIGVLAEQGDVIEFCGVDLQTLTPQKNLRFTHIASTAQSPLAKLRTANQAFSQIDWSKVDVVNLHFALYSLLLLHRIPPHIPIVFHFHGPWFMESQWEGGGRVSTWAKKWIESYVYNRCAHFIVLSQAFSDLLQTHYGIAAGKISVIPGGINIQQFQANLTRQDARRQLGFPIDRPVLFTPRRLVQRVGIEQLLQALVTVKQVVPDVWLAIAGKGAQRQALEQQVQQLGLTHHVKFLGYVSDENLAIAYQASDLTVVPSQALEGFGLILLESLASGTPVLSTPIGGMPEVLRPFDPNLITHSIKADAIAHRLVDFLSGTLELPSRQRCRQYAVEHFDWQMIAPRIRNVLIPRG